jgi:hypothetical protein
MSVITIAAEPGQLPSGPKSRASSSSGASP